MADRRPCWLKILDRLPEHVRGNLKACVRCDVDCLIGSVPGQFPDDLDERPYDTPKEMVLDVVSKIRVEPGHPDIQADLERLVEHLGGQVETQAEDGVEVGCCPLIGGSPTGG